MLLRCIWPVLWQLLLAPLTLLPRCCRRDRERIADEIQAKQAQMAARQHELQQERQMLAQEHEQLRAQQQEFSLQQREMAALKERLAAVQESLGNEQQVCGTIGMQLETCSTCSSVHPPLLGSDTVPTRHMHTCIRP